jgi:uncharacterized protein
MLRWPAWLALLWLLLPGFGRAAEPVPLPTLSARVTDLTATLDATQRGRLEAQLAAIDRSGRAQIAVLLLPTTQPETIEQFGIRLAEAWKVGRKGADNGVIVIVAKDDRKMRIEVGYGLEGSIPDAIAKRIVAERMAPLFKQGDFFGGLRAAIEGLDQATGGPASGAAPAVEQAAVPAKAQDGGGEHPDWFQWLFMLVVGAGILRLMFGLFGSLAAAAIGGWLGFMVFGSLALAIGAAVVIFLFSFVSLFSGRGGGGGFSSGGGFSDGGGFSGGGGSFGGGGASGDW